MSVLQKVTITIGCDHPKTCAEQFVAAAQKLGEAKTEAREAGWYFGENDIAFCPDDRAALGLKAPKKRATE